MSSDYVPKKDAEFVEWSRFLLSFVNAHISSYSIPPTAMEPILTLQSSFEDAYSTYENPNHGKVDVLRKNETRNVFKKALRNFNNSYLIYNPKVSDEDKKEMGLPLHDKTPTPIPTPSTHPIIKVERSQNHDEVILHLRDSKSGRRAKPNGVIGAVVYWLVSDTPIVDPEELKRSELVTRYTHIQQFPTSERGRNVYFAARWQNAKGEKGPWSDIVVADIS
jgi:hypothetical protein